MITQLLPAARFRRINLLLLATFIVTLLPVFAAADPELPADLAFRRVESLMTRRVSSADEFRRNFSSALTLLRQYRTQYTTPEQQAQNMFLAAQCHFRLGDYGQALAQLDSALAGTMQPDHRPGAMLVRGAALQQLGRTQDAATQLRTLLSTYSTHQTVPDAKLLLSQMLMEQGSTQEAISLLESLTGPGNPPWAMQAAQSLLPGLRMIGTPAQDFSTRDTQGQPIALTDFRGKVVLLDFWASWCGPCRMSMPGIVDIYNRYHDQGFDIIGISLDHTRQAMELYVNSAGMRWRQISEFSGWTSQMATLYGVQGIPKTFLIDQQGRIAGIDVKGVQLEAYLRRLLSAQSN